ncbi:MAG: DUF3048 domain-containing protein [Firmicutes bacterium]|nr:DUF3048 domain-containing protein [Bacillota bacterium]
MIKGRHKRFIAVAMVMVMCAAVMVIMSGCGKEAVEEKVTYTNPLTGAVTETEVDTARPLVVSIDNVNEAVPQSWLSKADLVYEFPVEGEQTRLQAIYYTEFPEHFGPIRSARPYFVDLAREYKAVFLAHGWSPQAKEYLMSGVVPYINAMNSGLDFYRVDDKPAPHNSYIKWETVKEEIDAQAWWDEKKKIKAFKFLKDGTESAGDRVDKVEFSYDAADCEFTYDAETNKYVRTVDGAEFIDKETGEPITVSNILVQKVKSSMYDEKRLKIDMCAGGDALLFTNGKVVKGTWSREDLDSRTIFVDAEGNQFRLSRGKSWVEVTNQDCDIDYEIIVEEAEEGEEE